MSRSWNQRTQPTTISAAWQSQIEQAQRQPWLLQELLHHGQHIFPRFSHYYQQLSALPRKTRRVLQKQFARSLAGAALLLALSPGTGLAATLTVTTIADEMTENGDCTLREAILSVNQGSTYNADCVAAGDAFGTNDTVEFSLTTPATITLGGGEIAITESVTIEGPGAADLAINGYDLSRIFNIDDADANTAQSVTISGLTLTGGSASLGGAILARENLTIDESVITDNFASRGGGLNWQKATNGSVAHIIDSTVSGNRSSFGGGIFQDEGSLIVEDSVVSGNSTFNYGGGILSISGTLDVTESTIAGNISDFHGGGIQSNGALANITKSLVSNNSASNEGGGFFNDAGTLQVVDSTIEDNTANEGGGFFNDAGTLQVTDSTVESNTANRGGGIYSDQGSLTVTKSTISNNNLTASGDGGGIFAREHMTVDASTITGNSASDKGGGIYWQKVTNNASAHVLASTVSGNNASNGGGIFQNDGSLTVASSTISDNTGHYGGGILSFADTLNVSHTTVSDNTANTGGGIQSNGAVANVVSSIVSGNSATTDGGGIFMNGGVLQVTASQVKKNTANNGGGLNNGSGLLTITTSTIEDNVATNTGGGIFNNTATIVDVTGSTIDGNSAASVGGGIYNSTGTLTIVDSTVSNNRATFDGGGFYNQYGPLTVTNSTVSGNRAGDEGGGIWHNEAVADVVSSTVSGNRAANSGGGVFLYAGGTMTFTNSIVANSVSGGDCQTSGGTATALEANIVEDATANCGVGTQIDPLLGPLTNNGGPTKTHLPRPGSPAIDMATGSVPTTDQRGANRPALDEDIGAVEVVSVLANAEQQCITQVHTKAALVSKAQNTDTRQCIQNAGRGRETDPDGCLTADTRGRVGRAEDQVTRAFTTRCSGSEPIVTTDMTTNDAHTDETLNMVHALFGPDLTNGGFGAVIEPGQAESRCQDKVWFRVSQLWDTKLRTFLSCQRTALRRVITDAASLARVCFTPLIPDGRNQIGRAIAQLRAEVVRQCTGLSTNALFPGDCVGEDDFAGCIEREVECRVCKTLNAADGLGRDCDHFDDLDTGNNSCPD